MIHNMSNSNTAPVQSAATAGQISCVTPHTQIKNTVNRELNIVYYNCRGLATKERIYEFENNIKNVKWDIIGIAENRRSGEQLIKKKVGYSVYYYGETKGYRGVGFYIKNDLMNIITEIKGISERICFLKIAVNKGIKILIIMVYAPTLDSEEEETDRFYCNLQNTFDSEREYYTIVMGDWNAKIGASESGVNNIGKYGLGVRNKNGERLIEFCLNNNLKVANTFFQKKIKEKWTWRSPNNITKNEIDHMLCNDMRIVKDVSVLTGFKFSSDHRMCRSTIVIKERAKYRNCKKKEKTMERTIPTHRMEEAREFLSSQLSNLNEKINESTVQDLYDDFEKIIKETAANFSVVRGKVKTDDKLSRETKTSIRERERMREKENKTNKEKLELLLLEREVRKQIRKDIRDYDTRKIMEILEESWSTKNIRREMSTGMQLVTKMKNKKGKNVYERAQIVQTATEFYENLYKTKETDNFRDINKHQEERNVGENETFPEIMKSETYHAIKSGKKGKATGPDGITNEIIKTFPIEIENTMTRIFNRVLDEERIPNQWKTAEIILLHKKGPKEEIKNYRPISLTSNAGKIYMKIIKDRIYPQIDRAQDTEQAGFRRGRSTIDQIFILNQLIEKAREYNFEIYLMFIDFQKAFDSVEHSSLWQALKKQGLEDKYLRVVKEIYKDAKAYIKMDRAGKEFPIKRGVRQGDPLSSNLFNSVIQEIFDQLNWQTQGIKINGEFLNNLRFADDIVLIAGSGKELEELGKEFAVISKKTGLEINMNKTYILSNAPKQRINIGGQEEVEWVNEVIYLGQLLSFEDRRGKEISTRVKKGWRNFWNLKDIYKAKVPINTKAKIWNMCTLPTLTYGAQTWALTKTETERLRTTQLAMERSMLGVKRKDKVRGKEIRERTGTIDVRYAAKKLKINYAGHISRRNRERWETKIEEWTPLEQKRKVGRPITRWRDELVKQFGIKWKQKAHNRKVWEGMGEAYARKWALE